MSSVSLGKFYTAQCSEASLRSLSRSKVRLFFSFEKVTGRSERTGPGGKRNGETEGDVWGRVRRGRCEKKCHQGMVQTCEGGVLET